jgi:type I restriction enzyme, S subunit
MSGMNFLEKLLDGVAVEWKALRDVVLPTSNIKWRNADRIYRYIDLTSVSLETKRISETTEITANNAPSRAQKLVEENDVIFATTRPAQQRYCLIDNEYSGEVASTGYCILRAKKDEVLPKWILYCIASNDFKIYVEENQSGSAYPAISDTKVKDFIIPLPCPENPDRSLAIQAEIVRILDTFTELTAELTAELGDRQKQYNYYRDRLLTFEEGEVEWKTLGEIGEFIRGKRFTKADYVDDGIPAIHYGEIYTHYGVSASHTLSQVRSEMAASLRYAMPGDVVIAGVGETVEDVGKAVAWIGSEKVAIHDDGWAFSHSINPKFVSYVMQTTTFMNEKVKYVSSGKVKRLVISGIEKIRIPIPSPSDSQKSLEEQARIVAILDKFDALTNSISEGLPREIALRQQQYEYYRDLLLTFPKPEAVEV